MKVLVVTNPFAGHGIGAMISDPAEMKDILGGQHAGHVVAAEYDGEAGHDAAVEAKPARNKTSQE